MIRCSPCALRVFSISKVTLQMTGTQQLPQSGFLLLRVRVERHVALRIHS
jgi:hypothetical protein